MVLRNKAFKYIQGDQFYLSTVLPFEYINKIAQPLIYGENPLGYQRQLDRKHYYDLARKLLKGDVTLPTAIVLGVSEEFIREFIDIYKDEEIVDFPINQLLEYGEKKFSVVDGQHRLAALELATTKDSSLLNYKLNIIILVNKDVNRIKEIKVFTDINSKAKRITTDLTLLAEYNYRLFYLDALEEQEILDHISVEVAYNLNDMKTSDFVNVWFGGIKIDVTSNENYGIIGVAAFKNSLTSIVKIFIEKYGYEGIFHSPTIEDIKSISKRLTDFLAEAWDITYHHWPLAFINENNENNYNSDFYIQKTTGVNALHQIISECLRRSNGNALENYKEVLLMSPIDSNDWRKKGIFSGLTSKSGFNKAVGLILNSDPKEFWKEFNF